jgi:polyhydroxyalkanoate synthesis regulator phasin
MVKKQPVAEKKQPVKGKRKSAKTEKPFIVDVIEQAMSASVGLALKTRDEAKKFADDFIKKAELSEKEGKKFIEDLLKRYDKSREKLEERVEKTVRDIVSRSGLATKDELEEIKAELKKLKETAAE